MAMSLDLYSLFAAIDRKDIDAYMRFIAPECRFRFGNMPEVVGNEAIREAVSGFFASIADLSHRITERFDMGDHVVCHGQVTYTRHDGSTLSVPFANVFRLGSRAVSDYLIFADISELYR